MLEEVEHYFLFAKLLTHLSNFSQLDCLPPQDFSALSNLLQDYITLLCHHSKIELVSQVIVRCVPAYQVSPPFGAVKTGVGI